MPERTERKDNSKESIERSLAASLKELTVRQPFEKITIRQITDGAGVIRVTFYNHFQDKYDLLSWIIRTEILAPAGILFENGMYREAIHLIFANLQREREFYSAAVHIEGQNSFAEISRECIYGLLLEFFTSHSAGKTPRHAWLTPAYLAQYYAECMNFIVLSWIRMGMTASPEEMAMIYEYVGTRSMWDVLQEL